MLTERREKLNINDKWPYSSCSAKPRCNIRVTQLSCGLDVGVIYGFQGRGFVCLGHCLGLAWLVCQGQDAAPA